jgi:hypothetical protein
VSAKGAKLRRNSKTGPRCWGIWSGKMPNRSLMTDQNTLVSDSSELIPMTEIELVVKPKSSVGDFRL